MSASEDPTLDLPANAPTVNKVWQLGSGETETQEWVGERTKILAKYEEMKALAEVGANIGQLNYQSAMGRTRLMATFGRTGASCEGFPDDSAVVEELYGVDIIRDVTAAPYFLAGGAASLTDDLVAAVRDAVQRSLKEADCAPALTNDQKQLRHHMIHGCDSYFETGFILRQSIYGVKTTQIKASFENINTVVIVGGFSTDMSALIDSLPDGEWLYKPPQAEHLGKGRWRITKEWHWAEAWSKIYGGSWGL